MGGRRRQKRNLTLRDDSNKSIELTLWGQNTSNPGDQLEAVRAFPRISMGIITAHLIHFDRADPACPCKTIQFHVDVLRLNRQLPF